MALYLDKDCRIGALAQACHGPLVRNAEDDAVAAGKAVGNRRKQGGQRRSIVTMRAVHFRSFLSFGPGNRIRSLDSRIRGSMICGAPGWDGSAGVAGSDVGGAASI